MCHSLTEIERLLLPKARWQIGFQKGIPAFTAQYGEFPLYVSTQLLEKNINEVDPPPSSQLRNTFDNRTVELDTHRREDVTCREEMGISRALEDSARSNFTAVKESVNSATLGQKPALRRRRGL
jgi:hypothetical protein